MNSPTILKPLLSSCAGISAFAGILAPNFHKDQQGQARVLNALGGLDAKNYRHFQNLELPNPGGTSLRIEHVVVSPFGIFVILTTRRLNWLLGSSHPWQWVRRMFNSQDSSNDPILQNRLRVDALMEFLKLPDPPFHPLVVSSRGGELMTAIPGVVSADGLLQAIQRHRITQLDSSMIRRAVSQLETIRDSSPLRQASEDSRPLSFHTHQAA